MISLDQPAYRRPRRTLRAPFCALAPVPQPAYLFSSISIFLTFVGKNDPHIRVLAGFPESGWDKLSGENSLGSRAFGGQ
jgi:hypothetical protein